MPDDEPDNQEDKLLSNPYLPSLDTKEKLTPQIINKILKPLIWFLIGGITFVAFSFILKGQWSIAIWTFITLVLFIIILFFLETVSVYLLQVYEDRIPKGIDSLIAWIEQRDKAIQETIKWQLAKTDDKYLQIQGNDCRDFTTEGLRKSPSIFIPILDEVFVPLELSSDFIRNIQGESVPFLPGFKRNAQALELCQKEGLRIWYILKQVKQYTAYSRLAILAWGGYGKTTLLRHIT